MSLHEFWFGQIELSEQYYAKQIKRWFFRNNPVFDKQCADFLNQEPSDPLTKILLMDQLPRNVYRGSRKAYERDLEAQALALSLMDTDYERSLTLPERIFLYMPLEHEKTSCFKS